MTREIALHCMKSASELESELCEECPIYGQTGCDHCYEDALQYVIAMLEQEPIDYETQYENYLKKSEVVISQLRADRDRLQDAFDKLRAEIEEPLKINQGLNTESAKAQAIALSWVLGVIDKYKAEIEPQESEG